MKRLTLIWVMILCLMLIPSIVTAEVPQYHPVEPVGTVPEAYAEVIRQNLLGNVPFMKGGYDLPLFPQGGRAVHRAEQFRIQPVLCQI